MNDQELIAVAQRRLKDVSDLKEMGLLPLDGQFFPSVHYPPITMYDTFSEEAFLSGYKTPADGRWVIYVHIPFCPSRCAFCHYPVTISSSEQTQSAYLDLLFKEIDMWRERLGVERFSARSVLIAGGTPTHLSPRLFRHFHEEFARRVDLTDCTQIAYDVHPNTLLGQAGSERLQVMRDYGSERLTIGIQSFDNHILDHMNRQHTARECHDSIKACRKAGYEDICIEFIYGYPTQSMQTWQDTLRTAISTGVEEIQLYRLKIVPYGDARGPIEREFDRHPERFPSLEESLLMKQVGMDLLADHGYNETLTRVFSKDPKYYSHYAWDQCCETRDCIGFGLSTFSSLRDRFCITPDSMQEYTNKVLAGRLPLNRGLVRNRDDQLRWHVILPLKNSRVVKADYEQIMGVPMERIFRHELDMLAAHDLLLEDDERVTLTPRGRFFADEVCCQFHHPRYMPFPRENYADGPLYLCRDELE